MQEMVVGGTISEAARFFEGAFDVLNKHLFESALSTPMITIQSTPGAFGHFTFGKVWVPGDGEGRHEINMGAEYLTRPIEETIATLTHEMVHMYNTENGVQDTSRGGTYHNKLFKDEAERRGLEITYLKRIGWSATKPGQRILDLCECYGWTQLGYARQTGLRGERAKKESSTRKYACPTCGQTVRATKAVFLLCGYYEERLVLVD